MKSNKNRDFVHSGVVKAAKWRLFLKHYFFKLPLNLSENLVLEQIFSDFLTGDHLTCFCSRSAIIMLHMCYNCTDLNLN